MTSKDLETNRELAEGWTDCNGRPEEIGMLTGLLDFVESRAERKIAAWLLEKSKSSEVSAAKDYYLEASRLVLNGAWRSPSGSEGNHG